MQRNPPQTSGEKSGRANSEARTAASGSKEAPATRIGIERDADTGTAGMNGHSVSMDSNRQERASSSSLS